MTNWNYIRYCKKCGEIKPVYSKKSKNCKDCVDETFNESFLANRSKLGLSSKKHSVMYYYCDCGVRISEEQAERVGVCVECQ